MLVSGKRRLLFIHVPKVAGLSISLGLRRAEFGLNPVREWFHLWEKRVAKKLGFKQLSPVFKQQIYPPDYQHFRARNWRDMLGKATFDQMFKIAFVRNPWDWQVSLYHFSLQDPQHPDHELVRSLGSFARYLDWRVAGRFWQKDFVTDEAGNTIVDFVGRFERLPEDFERVCKTLQLQHVALPHINASKHKDFRSYYTDTTRELVEKHFHEDIAAFGYTFDNEEFKRDAGKAGNLVSMGF